MTEATSETEELDGAPSQLQPAQLLKATGADVHEALREVIDPELGLDIVSLGLVYGCLLYTSRCV